MQEYYVYKHTTPSNKIYIGITKDYIKRWRNGLGYYRNKYFYAIQKYGWNNIKHEILFEGLSKEEAEQKEIALIAKYKSNQREFGYNHAIGGGVNCGYKLSMETRNKLSKSHMGLISGNKGKHLTKEQKEKLSKALKGKSGYWTGKQRSEETKKKISIANSGNHINVGDANYWYNKHFSEEHKRKISEANKGKVFTETHKKHLSNAIKGRKYSKEHIEHLIQSHNSQKVKIVQKTLTGEFIKLFDSIGDAARELQIDRRNISTSITANKKDNKLHKCHGYIFEYYNEGGVYNA